MARRTIGQAAAFSTVLDLVKDYSLPVTGAARRVVT
jgi:hypothetical protein